MNNIEIILRTLMKIHNFTQVELSIKTDIPLPTIRKYLKSEFNPTSKNIKKISENFEIDLSKLLKINLNNTEKLEDLELKYNLLLNKTLENIETYETDISLGDYGGHLCHLNYNPFDRLEDEEKNKRYFENTINFIKFLEKEINNRNEILCNWIENRGYHCHYLNKSYSNSNYHRKNKNSISEEVLITNYPVNGRNQ